MAQRILIVEDEESIRDLVSMNLDMENYEAVEAVDGREAMQKFKDQHFDLIILDVMLPEVDGFQLCEQIRLRDREIPILFLTAKDASQDRIEGLKKGGDDYLTKPFVLEELLLRIKNLLRRSSEDSREALKSYRFGSNTVNFATYEARTANEDISLTKKEALLLRLLIDRKNEAVSRQEILQSVWGYDVYPSTRTIDNFILSFRKYFEEDPGNPKYFVSVRGVGYKFVDPSEDSDSSN